MTVDQSRITTGTMHPQKPVLYIRFNQLRHHPYLHPLLFIATLWPAAVIAAWLMTKLAPSPSGWPWSGAMVTAIGAGLAALPFYIALAQWPGLLPAATLLIALVLIDW